MPKDVKDFASLLWTKSSGEIEFNQITDGMEVDPTALLRRLHGITIDDQKMTIDESKVIITVTGTMDIRRETGTAAEMLTGLHGFDWANAVKRCETVAKRRLTTNLLGYGYKHSLEEAANSAVATVAEPQAFEAPGPVNNAPATVVPDTRVTNQPITITPTQTMTMADLPATPVLIAPTDFFNVPFVTEAGLVGMHKEADTLGKQHTPQTEAYIQQPDAPAFVKVAAPMSSQGGFFDEPAPPGATQDVPTQANSVVPTQANSVEVIPAQSSTLGTPAVPAVGVFPPPEPIPVEDIKVEPVVSTAPSIQEYRVIQVRCKKLVHDVLPKAGKGAEALLLPYVRKRLGMNEIQKGSRLVWEEMLSQLEAAAAVPKDLATLLNGGKTWSTRQS